MIKRFLKLRLPSVAIIFMLIILCTSIINLIDGYETLSNVWILQILGFLIFTQIIDSLLAKINFQSYKTYFLTESILLYILLLLVSYWGNWFSFTPKRLIPITLIFFAINTYIHYYFYRLSKISAEEINELLKKEEPEEK